MKLHWKHYLFYPFTTETGANVQVFYHLNSKTSGFSILCTPYIFVVTLPLFIFAHQVPLNFLAPLSHASWPKNQDITQKQCCKKFNKDFKNSPHKKKKINCTFYVRMFYLWHLCWLQNGIILLPYLDLRRNHARITCLVITFQNMFIFISS